MQLPTSQPVPNDNTTTSCVQGNSSLQSRGSPMEAGISGQRSNVKSEASSKINSKCMSKMEEEEEEEEEESDLWVRLGKPRFVVAPMVDASELAWRELSRKHGAQLCYTPMFHSTVFVRDPRYRLESFITIPQDRPLIVQFCGNDAETLLEAGLLVQPYCDAIDINLGCPQAIAKRGKYGAFLQDDWDLLAEIVSTLKKGLSVPVTCKVRVFESLEKTVAYAKMLEEAGCQMLTVHGRTREQRGPLTGIASWNHIKAVRDNVRIPVIANGNIQCLADVERCLQTTRCHGVMTAEGSLYNPAIYEGRNPPCWEMADEYLDLVEQYPCPRSFIRGHMFKLFKHCLGMEENCDIREILGKASSMDEFRLVVKMFRDRYLDIHEGRRIWNVTYADYNLDLPPWLCQSYVRIPPEEHLRKLEEKVSRNADSMFDQKENQDAAIGKRTRDSTENSLSKKKWKKLQRREKNNAHCRREVEMCQLCKNPMGMKCSFALCKTCCRIKCFVDNQDCLGHRILIKTKRERERNRKKQIDLMDGDDNSLHKMNLIENEPSKSPDAIQDIKESWSRNTYCKHEYNYHEYIEELYWIHVTSGGSRGVSFSGAVKDLRDH